MERRLLGRVLRAEPAPWPAGKADAQRFIDLCEREGVIGLVARAFHSDAAGVDWPPRLRERVRHAARMQAATEILREHELSAVLAALGEAGADPLLVKGAALAHTHYGEPGLRPCCDADILVREGGRDAALDALEALGYRRAQDAGGTLVRCAQCLSRRADGQDHVVDLHWRISNGQVFARALGHAEARARAVPVPQLGPWARTLCAPHALLLACMHRAAHLGVDGPAGERLVWLYDAHLLARAMTAGEWREFGELCVERQMVAIAADALAHAHAAFGTTIPAAVADMLAPPATPELSASYVGVRQASALQADVRALDTWRERATFVVETLFPSPDYVLAKYGSRRRWLLPWWYLRRAVEGARKRMRRPGAGRSAATGRTVRHGLE